LGLLGAGGGRLQLAGGQDGEAQVLRDGLPGRQPQPGAAQQVAYRQPGRLGRLFLLALEVLQVEQAVGQLGVDPPGLVPAPAGADEAFPLDDPVVGQGIEVAQLT
jgi:hypothetical protein